tara:strand:+ start:208 stop:1374 length:1167 start_codon:yes stop_codon:yes gene_type:complete
MTSNLIKSGLLSLSLCFFSLLGISQTILSSDARVSLLTCDPGEEIYTLFGHSAIWVYDRETNTNKVYNYGTFDYNAPNFTINFLRGKLLYWLATEEGNNFLATYNYYQRSIKENKFQLDSVQMNLLYNALEENALGKNRAYLYDFFFDNCSTRIGDMLESVTGHTVFQQIDKKSLRDQLHEYLRGRDWTSFGIDLIIGSKADGTATAKQQMFLPDYLQKNLLDATFLNGKKVLEAESILVNHQLKTSIPFWITPSVLFAVLLLLEIFILSYRTSKKWIVVYDNLWLGCMAGASFILMFMWFGTDHQACALNYNLITFSPLIIVWLLLKKNINKHYLLWLGLSIILPMLSLPFVKMSIQNVPSATMLIAIITSLKIMKNGGVSELRKWM